MTPYLIGILAAFASPIFYAWANIVDSHFSNKLFDRLTPLLFFSSLVGLPILLVIWVVSPPSFALLPSVMAVLFTISIIEISYLYPYYWALRHADTSVIASLFSLGKIFVPLLAYLLVGEQLTGLQYVGFFILIAASILLSLDITKMRLNRAFFLMIGVSIALALQSVLFKYVFEQGVDWGTTVIWTELIELLVVGVLMLAPKNIADARNSLHKIQSSWRLFVGSELLGWGGALTSTYALYLIPVSVAKGIASTQPIFVLLYAFLFAQFWPDFFKEELGKGDLAKKMVLFVFTIIGTLLILS